MDSFEAYDKLQEPFEDEPTPEHYEAIRYLYDLPEDAEVHWNPKVGWQYRKPIDLSRINFTITVDR